MTNELNERLAELEGKEKALRALMHMDSEGMVRSRSTKAGRVAFH